MFSQRFANSIGGFSNRQTAFGMPRFIMLIPMDAISIPAVASAYYATIRHSLGGFNV